MGDEIVNVNGKHLRGIQSFQEVQRLLSCFVDNCIDLVIAHDEVATVTDFYTKIKIDGSSSINEAQPFVQQSAQYNSMQSLSVDGLDRPITVSMPATPQNDYLTRARKRLSYTQRTQSTDSIAPDESYDLHSLQMALDSEHVANNMQDDDAMSLASVNTINGMPTPMPLMQHRRCSTPRHSLIESSLNGEVLPSRRRARSSSGQRNLELTPLYTGVSEYTPVYANRASLTLSAHTTTISDDEKWQLLNRKRCSEGSALMSTASKVDLGRAAGNRSASLTIARGLVRNDSIESNTGVSTGTTTNTTSFPARTHYTRNSINLSNSHYRSLRFAHSRLSSSRLSLFSSAATATRSNSSNNDSESKLTNNTTSTTSIAGSSDISDNTQTNTERNEQQENNKGQANNDLTTTTTTTTTATANNNSMSNHNNPFKTHLQHLQKQQQQQNQKKEHENFSQALSSTTPTLEQQKQQYPHSTSNHLTVPKNIFNSCSSSSTCNSSSLSPPAFKSLSHHRPSLPVSKLTIRDEEMAEVIKASMSEGK